MNNWDGSLQIDNANNVILSAMMGAGTKDDQNRFSGVVMGQTQKVQDEATEEAMGLFGYHQGTQSFGFKTDGTAFIGKSGGGRIEFDGNQGIIQSAGFGEYILSEDEESKELKTGSKWDLDNASLSLIAQGEAAYLKFNEDDDKTLKLKVKDIDIQLTSDDSTSGNLPDYVSGRIDASADKLRVEFNALAMHSAMYHAICDTDADKSPKVI
jgi:hypothetical protein